VRRGRVTVVAPMHAGVDTAISKNEEAVDKSDKGADDVNGWKKMQGRMRSWGASVLWKKL